MRERKDSHLLLLLSPHALQMSYETEAGGDRRETDMEVRKSKTNGDDDRKRQREEETETRHKRDRETHGRERGSAPMGSLEKTTWAPLLAMA